VLSAAYDLFDMSAFWEGVLAGYGIAVPVGAIAILIVEAGLRRGFQTGFAAGAGAATVDTLYAAAAVLIGASITSLLAPYALELRLISALVLLAVGGFGLWRVRATRGRRATEVRPDDERGSVFTFAQFVGLTLLNPLTIVYFVALILGRDAGATTSTIDHALFVLGVALASLSWQTFLAGTGALANRYLSQRFQLAASLLGNLIVIGLGLRILVRVF
jgi:threonine/homoserine/homoserine lactone efflux protein